MVVSSSGLICSIREQPLYLPLEYFLLFLSKKKNKFSANPFIGQVILYTI